MKKNNSGLIVVALIALSLFFSPFLVNLLITLKSSIGFINESTQEVWINYYGAIIGGALTLVGVWWTIMIQQQIRKEDMAIQFGPIPQCSTVELNDPDGTPVCECKFSDGYIEIEFGLDIKNIGRGEIQNGHIKRAAYYTNLPESPTEIPLSEQEQPQKFIPASSNGCAKIHIPKIKLEYRKLVISAEYEYEDISSFSHTAYFDVFFYFSEFGKLDGIFHDTHYGKRDSFFPVDGSILNKQNKGD